MSKVYCQDTYFKLSEVKNEFNLKEVNVFFVDQSKYGNLVGNLTKYLSASEKHKASKYFQFKDRNRYVITRVLLKSILSKFSNKAIDAIEIDIDKNKKPFLVNHPSIHFNISHSNDYSVIVVSDTELGIDIEHINPVFDYKEIIPTIFNSQEIESVLTSTSSKDLFFKYWTRKEAIVKCIGKGIDDDFIKIPCLDGHHDLPLTRNSQNKALHNYSFKLIDDYWCSLTIGRNLPEHIPVNNSDALMEELV